MKNLKYPRKKTIVIAVLIVILCLMQCQTVSATNGSVPDANRNVSLQAHLETKDGSIVQGGVIKAYLVAEVDHSQGNLKYKIIPEYREAENELIKGDYTEAALRCKKIAESINPDAVLKTGENGTTERVNLGKKQGMYLILAENFPEGFQEAAPSIVAIPGYVEEDGNEHWTYDMLILPKISGEGKDVPTIPETPEKDRPRDPKTDDPQNPSIYLTLIAISIMGIWATKKIEESVE